MTEQQGDYTIDEDVRAQALREQMLSIHETYKAKDKDAGEFSIKDYCRELRALGKGVGYDRARTELEKAITAGKVERRKEGSNVYYRFISQEE